MKKASSPKKSSDDNKKVHQTQNKLQQKKKQTKEPEKKVKTGLQAEVGLLEIFRELDKDGSGQITIDELRQVMFESEQSMSEQEFNEMVAKVDKNNDKKIKYQEFVNLIEASFSTP
jgi:Ca2+-binding EF-hand superfamily protein